MRSKQRGFIYLTTGANGTGKTLFTLKEVHDRALKESRPVAYNGRFDLVPGGPLASWKKIDAKDWQAEPDGTIFFFDECQHDFPNRGKGEPPPYVAMITEHRKRGFDFYLLTQHPMNMDIFVRRLIGSPGRHVHLKRTFGADLVSRLEWAAVNATCEKPGSGDSGSTSMHAFPKEVYSWYKSAELHTGKRKIPKVVWITLAAALCVPAFGYFAAKRMMRPANIAEKVLGVPVAGTAAAVGYPTSGGPSAAAGAPAKMTPAQYVAAHQERLEGFPHTAPAYDGITQAVVAPYPAACIDGFNLRAKVQRCDCYTQQGTKLQVPAATCKQIAENGFFIEWAQPAPAAPPVERAKVVEVALAPQAETLPPRVSALPIDREKKR